MLPLDGAGSTMIGCSTELLPAVLLQSQTVNVAPPIGLSISFGAVVESFSTRTSPPTRKHAGPALRLLAEGADGPSVVFATLQIRVPTGVLAGIVTLKVRLKL